MTAFPHVFPKPFGIGCLFALSALACSTSYDTDLGQQQNMEISGVGLPGTVFLRFMRDSTRENEAATQLCATTTRNNIDNFRGTLGIILGARTMLVAAHPWQGRNEVTLQIYAPGANHKLAEVNHEPNACSAVKAKVHYHPDYGPDTEFRNQPSHARLNFAMLELLDEITLPQYPIPEISQLTMGVPLQNDTCSQSGLRPGEPSCLRYDKPDPELFMLNRKVLNQEHLRDPWDYKAYDYTYTIESNGVDLAQPLDDPQGLHMNMGSPLYTEYFNDQGIKSFVLHGLLSHVLPPPQWLKKASFVFARLDNAWEWARTTRFCIEEGLCSEGTRLASVNHQVAGLPTCGELGSSAGLADTLPSDNNGRLRFLPACPAIDDDGQPVDAGYSAWRILGDAKAQPEDTTAGCCLAYIACPPDMPGCADGTHLSPDPAQFIDE